jgi:hypothetical protein
MRREREGEKRGQEEGEGEGVLGGAVVVLLTSLPSTSSKAESERVGKKSDALPSSQTCFLRSTRFSSSPPPGSCLLLSQRVFTLHTHSAQAPDPPAAL